MAVRNPTAITKYIDEEVFLPGLPIIADEPDSVQTDMVYVLDAPHLVISDFFWPIELVVNSDGAGALIGTWIQNGLDMCGDDSYATEVTLKVSARVWVDATHTGNINVITNGDSDNTTFTNNTPAWISTYLSMGYDCDDDQETVEVDIWCSTGDGAYDKVYIDALVAWVAIR